MTRRLVIAGIGTAVIGGVGIVVHDEAPKVIATTEHDLQASFNAGLVAGGDQVRREFLKELDNFEGFSLDAAITTARLTRVAYDTFVAPIVEFCATISTDFLLAILQSFKTARGWLANINQDNVTLAAIQKVLETWVNQARTMPKEINTITETDLDGAQAYLRALKNKMETEKAKLDSPASKK